MEQIISVLYTHYTSPASYHLLMFFLLSFLNIIWLFYSTLSETRSMKLSPDDLNTWICAKKLLAHMGAKWFAPLGFDPRTFGLWAQHASSAPRSSWLVFTATYCNSQTLHTTHLHPYSSYHNTSSFNHYNIYIFLFIMTKGAHSII